MPQPIAPEPGQESVWDYPRPPKIEASSQRAVIIYDGITIADSCSTQRVLETSHPPVYYFPPQDVRTEYLELSTRHSYCEWKGEASYYHLNLGDCRRDNVAWFYPTPNPSFSAIKDYIAFYPSKMDACYVDEELVTAQPGDFYGGWITSKIVGPFKGGIGTWGW